MAKKKEKVRRGVSAVVFRYKTVNGKKEPEFLILHRIKRWTGWEMLKGGRIGREKPLSNLMRELREEIKADTNKISSIIPIPFKLKFKTPPEYVKKYKYTAMEFPTFLVEYNGDVSVTHNEVLEHDMYKWVSYKEAMKLLTYDTTKKQLQVAYKYLQKISKANKRKRTQK